MIGREPLTAEQRDWNRRWGAPKGRAGYRELRRWFPRQAGPFGFQPNSSTRRFEYPWAFAQCAPARDSTVVDIGGGFSGLPFVLASEGARATIVDPFVDYGPTNKYGGPRPSEVVATMNRAFGTDVAVIASTIEESGIPPNSVDTVLCISVIEHLDHDIRLGVMKSIHDILVPGGKAVFTVDLFLDVHPFAAATSNQYGSNADIAELVACTPMELVQGDRSELYGFPEFSAESILASRGQYVEGRYPVLPQAFTLVKN